MEINIVQYLGKFHPLVVHLPIGILLVAVLFGILCRRESFRHLQAANRIILFLGAVSATIACLTGFILHSSGQYGSSTAQWHQWMGISLALISWSAFFASNRGKGVFHSLLVIMLFLLVSTGHLGGSLTHGSDFIVPPPVGSWFDRGGQTAKPLVLTNDTKVYDAVANIVDRKCKSCHGPNKQKGKLRLDTPEHLFAGGKNGKVILVENPGGSPAGSPLVERISLPIDDEDHMPPNEKPQLNEAEVQVLVKWIESGAGMDMTIAQLSLPDDLMASFSENDFDGSLIANYAFLPEGDVGSLSEAILFNLKALEIQVLPVAIGNNYLRVNLLQVKEDSLLKALDELLLAKDQTIWLDVSNKQLHDEHLKLLSQMESLTRLDMSGCNLSDEALSYLTELDNLQSLNLVNNSLSAKGVAHLARLKQLKHLYLYQNVIAKSERGPIEALLPAVEIDFGDYGVPVVAADTVKFKF